MNDFDVALVGHFLKQAATETQNPAIDSLSRWHYEGPGVWTGIDENALSGSPDLFTSAISLINKFNDLIPVSYLNEHLRFTDMHWTIDQPTLRVISCIHQLRNFIIQDTEQDAAAHP